MEGQVIGLGTVHILLTLNLFSSWFPPFEKRKTLSSAMDGIQKKMELQYRLKFRVIVANPKGGKYDGPNDLVVGEDHLLGLNCQRYYWQTGK